MIEFLDELPPVSRKRNWRKQAADEFSEALRTNVGRWAKWPTPINENTAYTYANSINRGTKPGFSDGSFEAEYRLGVLYVRVRGDGA